MTMAPQEKAPPPALSSRKLHGLRGKHSVAGSLGRYSSSESSSHMGTSSGHSTVSSIHSGVSSMGSSNHSLQQQQQVRGQEGRLKAPPGSSIASTAAPTVLATASVASVPQEVSGRSRGLGLGRRRGLNNHLHNSSTRNNNEINNASATSMLMAGSAEEGMHSEQSIDTTTSMSSLPGMPNVKQITSRRGAPARRGLGTKKVSTMTVVEPNSRPMVSSLGGVSPLEHAPAGATKSTGLRGSFKTLLSTGSSLTSTNMRNSQSNRHQLPSSNFMETTTMMSANTLSTMPEGMNVLLDSDDDDDVVDSQEDERLRAQQRACSITQGMAPPSTTHRAIHSAGTELGFSRAATPPNQNRPYHHTHGLGHTTASLTASSTASLTPPSYRRVGSVDANSGGNTVVPSQRRLHPISGDPMSASVTDAVSHRRSGAVGAYVAHTPPAPHAAAAATSIGAHLSHNPPTSNPAAALHRRVDSSSVRARNNVRQASMRIRSAIPPVAARPITAPVVRAPVPTPGTPLSAVVRPLSPTPAAPVVAPNSIPLSAAVAAVQQRLPSPPRPTTRPGAQNIMLPVAAAAPALAVATDAVPAPLYQPSQADWAALYNRHVEELERKDLEIAMKLSTKKPAVEEVIDDDDASLDGVELAMEVSRREINNPDPNEDEVLQMVMEMSRTTDMNASVAITNGASVNNMGHLISDPLIEEGGEDPIKGTHTIASFLASEATGSEDGIPKESNDPDEELLLALRLSSQEPAPLAPLSEEEELERVLRLSAESEQASPPEAVSAVTSGSNDNDNNEAVDEDVELRRILELSQQEHEREQQQKQSDTCEGEDDDFLRVLELSQQEAAVQDKERETMELVLQLSRQETGL